jgi:hypothetical protein
MILRSVETAIQGLLQASIDDAVGFDGVIPVILSDSDDIKVPMPYVVLQCISSEEAITPGCGIFRVDGELEFRSHTKETSPEMRQEILDAINNFAYDSTAAKLSEVDNFHCHGWYPTTGELLYDNETKSMRYRMKYWIYCMAMDN